MSAPLSGPGSAPQAPGREPVGPGLTAHVPYRAAARADHRDRPRRQGGPARPGGRRSRSGRPSRSIEAEALDRARRSWWRPPPASFYLYLTRRHIPAKYLVPGHALPDRLPGRSRCSTPRAPPSPTSATATAAPRTRRSSPSRPPRSPRCPARPSTPSPSPPRATRPPAPLVFLITDPATGDGLRRRQPTGCAKLDAGRRHRRHRRQGHRRRRLHRAELRPGQRAQPGGHRPRRADRRRARIRSTGLSRAYEGKAVRAYDAGVRLRPGQPRPARPGPPTRRPAPSSPPTASGSPRAGRSASG